MKDDPRVQRTKRTLRRALLDLMRTVRAEDVTVKLLLDEAQMSKKAFYAHYHDLYELMCDTFISEDRYFSQRYKRVGEYEGARDVCVTLLEQLASYLEFCKQNAQLALVVVSGCGSNPLFAPYYEMTLELLESYTADEHPCPVVPFVQAKECAAYVHAGMASLTRQWLLEGAVEPVETVAKRLALLNLHTLGAASGSPIRREYLQAIVDWRCGA